MQGQHHLQPEKCVDPVQNTSYLAYGNIVFLKPARPVLPHVAFTSFEGAYEAPSVNEGFSEMRDVPWRFEGSEEERRHWSMWLQVDGK